MAYYQNFVDKWCAANGIHLLPATWKAKRAGAAKRHQSVASAAQPSAYRLWTLEQGPGFNGTMAARVADTKAARRRFADDNFHLQQQQSHESEHRLGDSTATFAQSMAVRVAQLMSHRPHLVDIRDATTKKRLGEASRRDRSLRERKSRNDSFRQEFVQTRQDAKDGIAPRAERLGRGIRSHVVGVEDVRSTAEQRCVKRIVDKFRIVWDEDPGARKRLLAMLQMPQTSLPRSYGERVPSVDDQTAHKFREFVATHLRQAVHDIATAYDNVLQSEQAAFMLRAERIKATYAEDVKRTRDAFEAEVNELRQHSDDVVRRAVAEAEHNALQRVHCVTRLDHRRQVLAEFGNRQGEEAKALAESLLQENEALTNEVATANQTVLRTVSRSLFGNRSNDVQRAEARQQPPPAAARASTRLRAALSRSHAAPPRAVKDARKDNTPQSGEEEKLQVEAVTGADAPAKSSHPMSVRRDVVSGNVAAEDRASISGDTVGDNGCSTPADGSGEHEEQSDIDEGDDASAATGEQSDHEFENHDGSDSDVDGYPESPDGRSFSAPAASPLSLEESSPAEEMVPLATLEAVKRSHAHEVRQLQSEVERMSRIFRDGKHELLALQEKHQYLQAMYKRLQDAHPLAAAKGSLRTIMGKYDDGEAPQLLRHDSAAPLRQATSDTQAPRPNIRLPPTSKADAIMQTKAQESPSLTTGANGQRIRRLSVVTAVSSGGEDSVPGSSPRRDFDEPVAPYSDSPPAPVPAPADSWSGTDAAPKTDGVAQHAFTIPVPARARDDPKEDFGTPRSAPSAASPRITARSSVDHPPHPGVADPDPASPRKEPVPMFSASTPRVRALSNVSGVGSTQQDLPQQDTRARIQSLGTAQGADEQESPRDEARKAAVESPTEVMRPNIRLQDSGSETDHETGDVFAHTLTGGLPSPTKHPVVQGDRGEGLVRVPSPVGTASGVLRPKHVGSAKAQHNSVQNQFPPPIAAAVPQSASLSSFAVWEHAHPDLAPSPHKAQPEPAQSHHAPVPTRVGTFGVFPPKPASVTPPPQPEAARSQSHDERPKVSPIRAETEGEEEENGGWETEPTPRSTAESLDREEGGARQLASTVGAESIGPLVGKSLLQTRTLAPTAKVGLFTDDTGSKVVPAAPGAVVVLAPSSGKPARPPSNALALPKRMLTSRTVVGTEADGSWAQTWATAMNKRGGTKQRNRQRQRQRQRQRPASAHAKTAELSATGTSLRSRITDAQRFGMSFRYNYRDTKEVMEDLESRPSSRRRSALLRQQLADSQSTRQAPEATLHMMRIGGERRVYQPPTARRVPLRPRSRPRTAPAQRSPLRRDHHTHRDGSASPQGSAAASPSPRAAHGGSTGARPGPSSPLHQQPTPLPTQSRRVRPQSATVRESTTKPPMAPRATAAAAPRLSVAQSTPVLGRQARPSSATTRREMARPSLQVEAQVPQLLGTSGGTLLKQRPDAPRPDGNRVLHAEVEVGTVDLDSWQDEDAGPLLSPGPFGGEPVAAGFKLARSGRTRRAPQVARLHLGARLKKRPSSAARRRRRSKSRRRRRSSASSDTQALSVGGKSAAGKA